MLEMIYAVPENIGWVIVGVSGTVCAMMLFKLGELFVQMLKEWHEEDNEEE